MVIQYEEGVISQSNHTSQLAGGKDRRSNSTGPTCRPFSTGPTIHLELNDQTTPTTTVSKRLARDSGTRPRSTFETPLRRRLHPISGGGRRRRRRSLPRRLRSVGLWPESRRPIRRCGVGFGVALGAAVWGLRLGGKRRWRI